MLLLLFSLIGGTLFSCNDVNEAIEDHFFVHNDGAAMPVYVRGNLVADKMILFLHGGPGGNASQATFIPSFQELEQHYPIAYWDQRASGLSQGNPSIDTYTVDQFVEDTRAVVLALKRRYPGKDVYLLGHSWGGALGAAYLSTSDFQDDVGGFICMNSGHNLEVGLPLSVDWVENYASEQVDTGIKVQFWEEVVTWCSANPDMTDPANYFEYLDYLLETDAYRHDNQEVEIGSPSLGDILNSRLNLGILVGGQHLSRNFNILELNLSDDMGRITIPTLVLWGQHDGVNTLEMGYDAFHSIGTDSTRKQMVILQNSAHEGYVEEPELFVEAVLNFVERN